MCKCKIIGKLKTEQEAWTLYNKTKGWVSIILSSEMEQGQHVNYYYVETGVPLVRMHERVIAEKEN